MVDFLLVIIELFACSYGSDVISRYWSNSAFFKGGGTLSANFRWKGTSPTKLCLCPKTRVITVSGGIKILAIFSFVSSQRQIPKTLVA